MLRVILSAVLLLFATPTFAREPVDASPPTNLAVTLYRDPERGVGQAMDRNWPRGFAMITETRTITLPPGESTIRFDGVAEGMVAVSAIVTGLPGGTIEKNRNADLLSPGALVDGTLGNRVTITRTNPATGVATSEQAIVRTGAYWGLILETSQGFEAVRCAGLPEKLTFDRVPAGLSPQPVFSIDTRDANGGTYTVQLTYLAWGFDWQAHYVATLAEDASSSTRGDKVNLRLMSWLTILNDNGQSFPDAELLVVAGKLNVTSDFEELADAPDGEPLRLVCYPRGSTAEGSPEDEPAYFGVPPPPAPPPPPPMMESDAIMVTAQRLGASAPAMVAVEEALGDLKLYRVPERVTVAAKALKQVAFLDRGKVEGRLLYKARCSPWDEVQDARTGMMIATVNDKRHGLGAALPMGGVTVFEPSAFGDQLVGEEQLRDYAEGQDVEIDLGESPQVYAGCFVTGDDDAEETGKWSKVTAVLTNANSNPVTVRLSAGSPASWRLRGLKRSRLKDGETIVEIEVPANGKHEVVWEAKRAGEI